MVVHDVVKFDTPSIFIDFWGNIDKELFKPRRMGEMIHHVVKPVEAVPVLANSPTYTSQKTECLGAKPRKKVG